MKRYSAIRPLLAAGLFLICPALAAAQETVPLPPPEEGAEMTAPDTSAASPNPVSAAPDERQSCKRVVVVDEEPRDWRHLEIGVDAAWDAYTKGDYAKSVPVFEKLAAIGHPVAQWLMGHAYFLGQGVPQDQRQALQWFEKAANQGCFAAYAPTAQMLERGQGTPVDLGQAYAWYNIAVAQLPDSEERDDMIERREKVAAQMNPAQVEAAQKRSNLFKPAPVVPPDLEDLPVDYLKP
jgi:Sel1 repeat